MEFPLFNQKMLDYRTYQLARLGSGVSLYLPLNDASGSSAVALKGTNATYGGTIQYRQATSVTGYPCIFSNSLGHVTIPNSNRIGTEGFFSMFAMPTEAAWQSGSHHFFRYYVDLQNYIAFNHSANFALTSYWNNTPSSIVTTKGIRKGWIHLAYTWSKVGNYLRLYVNGGKMLDVTYKDDMQHAANPIITISFYANMLLGNVSDFSFGGVALSNNDIFKFTRGLKGFVRMTVLGDSISSQITTPGWATNLCANHSGHQLGHTTWATGGATILENLASQVTSAQYDDAHIGVIAFGTNDDDNGDMSALGTILGNNVVSFKAHNPKARVFVLGVLPTWTDPGGSTPRAKGNIRTMQQEVSQNAGAIYIDPFTVPWITSSQTTDGVHLTTTVGGGADVVAEKMEQALF